MSEPAPKIDPPAPPQGTETKPEGGPAPVPEKKETAPEPEKPTEKPAPKPQPTRRTYGERFAAFFFDKR